MRYFAANAVPLSPTYTGQATFPAQGWFSSPMNKLDAFVNGTDAVVQLLTDQSGWQDDESQEILLRMGFNGRDPLPPFYAVRFRVWPLTLLPQTGGTIDLSVFSL